MAVAAARVALRQQGLFVGTASGAGHNCLIDALLQCLSRASVLPADLAHDADLRADIAATLRQHLVHHALAPIRPCERDHLGRPLQRGQGSDAEAYLQHHIHAEPVILELMAMHGVEAPHRWQLFVHTPWDGEHGAVDEHAFGHGAVEVTLHLFNTGNYEPVYNVDIELQSDNGAQLGSESGSDAEGGQRVFPPLPNADEQMEMDVEDLLAGADITAEQAAVPPSIPECVHEIGLPDSFAGDPRHAYEMAVASLSGCLEGARAYTEAASQACHCAFQGCGRDFGSEAALVEHVAHAHRAALANAAEARSKFVVEDADTRAVSAYLSAVEAVCQQDAPTASLVQDRACLRRYAAQLATVKNVSCFVCAGRYTRVEGEPVQEMAYYRLTDTLAPGKETGTVRSNLCAGGLSLAGYVRRHAQQRPTCSLQQSSEWTRVLDGETLLCCPEDVQCEQHAAAEGALCDACLLPICRSCAKELQRSPAHPPQLALSNDLWTSYMPREIVTHAATVLELIAASPVTTSLLCFSLDHDGARGPTTAHKAFMPPARYGARGNVTSFPLPWPDVLRELSAMEAGVQAPAVPKTGVELAETVQVLVRRGSWTEATDANRVLQHARVRRRVVLDLIRGAVQRQHRGYDLIAWADPRGPNVFQKILKNQTGK